MDKCNECGSSGQVFREGFYPCPKCNEESMEYKNRQLRAENERLRDLLIYTYAQYEEGNPIPWAEVKKGLIKDGLYKESEEYKNETV